jgi:hypothetical protein
MDQLRLASNAAVLKMIRRRGTEDEQVVFSALVNKINRRGKAQTRVLMITSRAVYNLSNKELSKCKRRIVLEDIAAIVISSLSDELVLHVPTQYDYKIISQLAEQVADTLNQLVQTITLFLDTHNLPFYDGQNTPTNYYNIAQQQRQDHKEDEDESVEITKSNSKVSLKSFEIISVLGKGTYGTVFKVKKKQDSKIYAMKMLKKKFIYQNQQIEKAKLERQILAAFSNPFLNTLHYAFQTKDKLYLVIDYYPGGELYHHLEKVIRFTEDQARIIAAEVVVAIGHLHSLNFIYRDL